MLNLDSSQSKPAVLVGSVRLVSSDNVILQTLCGRIKARLPDGFIWQLEAADQVLSLYDQRHYWVTQLLRRADDKTLKFRSEREIELHSTQKVTIRSPSVELFANNFHGHFLQRSIAVSGHDHLQAQNRHVEIEEIASQRSKVDIRQADEVGVNAGHILFNC